MSTSSDDSFRLPAKLFEPETEPTLESHINYYSRFSLFDENWDKTFKDELDYIQTSPFGPIYRLAKENKFVWSGTLVHFLLANQLVTNRKYELWSLFGGQPLRFSLNEYEFITGLSCEDYPTDLVEDNEEITSRWSRMLKSKKYPSLQDLQEMASDCSQWTSEDRKRLALLMILAGIVMARTKGAPLPREAIELVRNIQRFEKYPWGRTGFKILIDSIHEVKDDLCNPSYTIDGFVQVLQIWGYEAVSMIAKKVKAHAENEINGSSIMLKWNGSRPRTDYFVLEQRTEKVDVNSFLVNEDQSSILAPQWKDEIQDPLVSNLIGEILCGTKFENNTWTGHGLKQGPSRKEVLIPKMRAKRKKMSSLQNEGEVTETEELVSRSYFDLCFQKLHKAISDGFDGLETKVERLDTKISDIQQQVKTMQQLEPHGEKNQSLSMDSTPVARKDVPKGSKVVPKGSKTIKYDLQDESGENFPQVPVHENDVYCSDNRDNRDNQMRDEQKGDSVQTLLVIPSLGKKTDSVQSVSTTPSAKNKADSVQSVSPTPSLQKNFKTRKLRMVDEKLNGFIGMLQEELEIMNRENGLGPSPKYLSIPRKKKKTSIKSLSFYDPFEPVDNAKVDALNEWSALESNELELGFYKVNKKFWEILITEKKWLHSGHIDACMLNISSKKIAQNPDSISK